MFKNFGKKKDAAPAEEGFSADQAPAAQQFAPAAGQSLFAREINPPPANIDFFSTAPVFGPAWEPPSVPPPLPEDQPPGIPEAMLPGAPMGYAEPLPPPELAPYTPPPPAEQLPWETAITPPTATEVPAWDVPPATGQPETAHWEQTVPAQPPAIPETWDAPLPMPEAAPWEQPAPMPEPAAWEPSAPMAEPVAWETPVEAPPPVEDLGGFTGMPAAEPFSWEAPVTEEPPQLAQIYPEDAFQPSADTAWSAGPEPGLAAPVADFYPVDTGLEAPVGETVPMPDLQVPPPAVDDPFATHFEEEPAVGGMTEPAMADPMAGFGLMPDVETDPMQGFGAVSQADPFGAPAMPAEPAPDLSAHLYSGPAESAEDPFTVDASLDPFAVDTASVDPFAIDAVGEDVFSPSLDATPLLEAPGGFGLDAAPGMPATAPADTDFHFEPPGMDEVTSGTPALDLWDNLDTGTTAAGTQFPDAPEAPGQFLDSVNSQLYPDDPFSIDTGTLSESAQAFEEASHMLFPETASAPVEWEDSGVGEPDPLLNAPAYEPPPLELGPSFQAETEVISDLTDSYAPPEPISAYGTPQPTLEPSEESFGFADDGDVASTWSLELPASGAPATESAWESPVEEAPAAGMHPYADPADHLPVEPIAPAHPYAEPEPGVGISLEPVPDFPTLIPPSETAAIAPETDDFSHYGAFSPTEPLSNPDLTDAFGEEADTMVPTYSLDNVVPLPFPAVEPEPAPAPAHSAPPSDGGLEMENLQILGFCGLDDTKRLLMVESNGTFALMGQAGEAHNPSITKIKEFPYNPLQYQNTFTAVKESAAGDQGMYLVQVGTWRAIVSTVKETILLHTELG